MNKLKEKLYIHQNIPYAFNLNRDHYFFQKEYPKVLHFGPRNNEYKKLRSHFIKVLNGKIPNHLFNSRDFPRISQFKIKGVKNYYLKIFSKKLIRQGIIDQTTENSKLLKLTNNVFDNFSTFLNKKPGHNPILKNILIKDQDSLAIEIPIWKKFQNVCLTGHIDLIQLKNRTLKVIDYKPEGNFIISLPQVAMYGILMRNLFDLKDLKCISFNKEEVWEYDPLILLNEITDFLESNNIKKRDWEKFI